MRTFIRRLLLATAPLFLFFPLGCKSSSPSQEEPATQNNPAIQRGQRIFETHCAACHNATSAEPLHGPGLKRILKKKYLPSGMPANDEQVRATIQFGRNIMPAFRDLDDMQLDDLLAYLHTL